MYSFSRKTAPVGLVDLPVGQGLVERVGVDRPLRGRPERVDFRRADLPGGDRERLLADRDLGRSLRAAQHGCQRQDRGRERSHGDLRCSSEATSRASPGQRTQVRAGRREDYAKGGESPSESYVRSGVIPRCGSLPAPP